MKDMRSILKAMMAAKGHKGHTLSVLSGVPGPTIYRFLIGKHDDPKSANVKKWAEVYGVTEAQLRGLEPIPWINEVPDVPSASTDLMELLDTQEYKLIMTMRRFDKRSRNHVFGLVKYLDNQRIGRPPRPGETIYAPVGKEKLPTTGSFFDNEYFGENGLTKKNGTDKL